MKKNEKDKNRPLYISIVSLVVVLALFLIYVISSGIFMTKSAGILMPDAEAAELTDGSKSEGNETRLLGVVVSNENIKNVIASLERPSAFSYEVTNRLIYDGGESTYWHTYYERNGVVRVDTLDLDGRVVQTSIQNGNSLYSWTADDSTLYTGQTGEFSTDAVAMLPRYLDILSDEAEIISVTQQTDSEPMIAVLFHLGGYRCQYTISVVSGLLMQANFYQEEVLVRSVTMQEVSTELPSISLFKLPDGKSVLGVS